MEEFILNPEQHINFNGKDWNILRAYLKDRSAVVVDQLCGDKSLDETTMLRGQLRAYRDLLSLEQMAASQAAKQE